MKLSDIFTLLLWSICAYTIWTIIRAIYNITFHPLARYPGPKLYAAFEFPRHWDSFNGNHASVARSMHDKYGEVVRCAPDVLTFSNSQALRDIYGAQRGKKALQKDPEFYRDSLKSTPHILGVNDADHARLRRVLSHAFSEQALRDQEDYIHEYTDLLVSRLHDQITGPNNGKVDLVRWLNFTTFDIIGDLAFDESFQALERGEYHFWIATIFQNLKFGVVFRIAKHYPILNWLLLSLINMIPAAAETMARLKNDTRDKTMRRIESKTDRRDFISHFLRARDEKSISTEEIISNAGLFILAGSETSATLLSGMIFSLLKNPACLSKLRNEIRSSFNSPQDMTFANEAKLPYLQACIEEALRVYPPAPIELPRLTPPEGVIINGDLVPGNVAVGFPYYAAFHSAKNFKDPDSYRPERWLGDPEYANDDFTAMQPFSVGSRNCIGKNLAYAEIRSIICRVLWNFELKLCPESNEWDKQKVYFLWDKNRLMVELTAAV